jgi:hypothetical protein
LTPCGGADRIDGVAIDAGGERYLKARVRAAPEDGKANAALEALVARVLRVAKGQVSVIRGSTSRMKTLGIEGVSEAEIAAFVGGLGEG